MTSNVQQTAGAFSRSTITRLNDVASLSDPHLFVLNKGVAKYGKKSQIIIPQALAGGHTTVSITIPSTWIPYDLTEHAPKEALLDNMYFRNLVATGVLQPMTTAEAKRRLEEPDAQAELFRLRNKPISQSTARSEFAIENFDPKENGAPKTAKGNIGPAVEVNSAVFDMFQRADINDATRLSSLRTLADALSAHDLKHVLANTDDRAIITFATELLSER